MEISCLSAPFPVVARCSLAWLPLPGLHSSPSWHILPHLLLLLASDCALSGRLAFALAPSSWQLLYACLHVDINVDGDANGDVDGDGMWIGMWMRMWMWMRMPTGRQTGDSSHDQCRILSVSHFPWPPTWPLSALLSFFCHLAKPLT